jgi:uncharacterized protein YkwD
VKRVPLALALAIAVTGALSWQRAPAVEGAAHVPADRFEAKLFDRLNSLRLRRGLPRLRRSPSLATAAHRHSRDMARNGFCGHQSTSGASFGKRLSRLYGRERGWRIWAVGENVLCQSRLLTAAGALREWLESPGHRANLLAPRWRDVGLGAVYADSEPEEPGSDILFLTADFGVRA